MSSEIYFNPTIQVYVKSFVFEKKIDAVNIFSILKQMVEIEVEASVIILYYEFQNLGGSSKFFSYDISFVFIKDLKEGELR